MPLIILAIGVGIIGLAIGFYITLKGNNDVNDRINQFIEKPDSLNDIRAPARGRERHLDKPLPSSIQPVIFCLEFRGDAEKTIAGNWPVTVSEYLFLRF